MYRYHGCHMVVVDTHAHGTQIFRRANSLDSVMSSKRESV